MKKIIVILGPTATGKTALAVKLARCFNGEIISADSRQIYREMDIGTGKDLKEYKEILCHLIDIIKPSTQFNVAKFKKRAERAIVAITARGKIPFLVGGTGLYISALVENYQFPDQAKPKYKILQLGLKLPKQELNKKIDRRVEQMIKNGLVAETKKLIKKYNKKTTPLHTIGYAEIIDYLNKKTTLKQAEQLIKIHTHQFAKRQMTWFSAHGGSPAGGKRGKQIIWIKNQVQAKKLINRFLEFG